MGIEVAIAAISAGVGIFGAAQGVKARGEAKDANAAAAVESKKAQSEQKALNYQQQAIEQRNQIREERVRRARIIQASENGGSAGSSGEVGALAGMSTQLNSNLGINAGRAVAGNNIGGYQQNAADFNLAAQNASAQAQQGDQLFNIGTSLFSASGGFNGGKKGK